MGESVERQAGAIGGCGCIAALLAGIDSTDERIRRVERRAADLIGSLSGEISDVGALGSAEAITQMFLDEFS